MSNTQCEGLITIYQTIKFLLHSSANSQQKVLNLVSSIVYIQSVSAYKMKINSTFFIIFFLTSHNISLMMAMKSRRQLAPKESESSDEVLKYLSKLICELNVKRINFYYDKHFERRDEVLSAVFADCLMPAVNYG